MGAAVIVAYAFHWWVAVLVMLAAPPACLLLWVLAIWLGYRGWRSDS